MKKIKLFLLVAALTMVGSFTACGDSVPTFEFSESVPVSASLYQEINFKNYFEENEDADYKLYVSYTDPVTGEKYEEKELSSMIFRCEKVTTYTFKIERILKGKSTYLTCVIEINPQAPSLTGSQLVKAEKGDTLTFEELWRASQILITPSDLEDDIKFESLDVESVVFGGEDKQDVDVSSLTSYTFEDEGIYTFTVSAENKTDKATAEIKVQTYNEVWYAQKATISYDEASKVASWEAVADATAYSVWVGDGEAQTITDTTFSFVDSGVYPDGEYVLNVRPIYGDIEYEGAEVSRALYVGYVKDPIAMETNLDGIVWERRPFAVKYIVTEKAASAETATTYEYAADVLSHKLQGTYAINDPIVITLEAVFDDNTKTDVATLNTLYGEMGEATLKRIEATSGVASGIEGIAFEMGESGNTWFLVEFEGKNAPNYAVRAQEVFDSWSGVQTIGKAGGNEHTPEGMLITNSSEKTTLNVNLWRGTNSKDHSVRGNAGNSGALGMYRYQEGTRYIQIVGYQINLDEEGKHTANESVSLITYLFTIGENGALTLVSEKVNENVTWAAHCLTGTKAIIYGNINEASNVDAKPENSPESVTFKYARPANSLNALLYNICDNYEYKAQLISMCGATEPSEAVVPNRVPLEKTPSAPVTPDQPETPVDPETPVEPDTPVDPETPVEPDTPVDPEEPENANEELSEEVTLNKIDATAGIAENVGFIEFKGLSGNTWFITEFTGKNSPNYAVRAISGYATWDEDTAANTVKIGDVTTTKAGILLANSSENQNTNISVYRGTNTGKARSGHAGGTPYCGIYRYADNKHYIQIVGYEIVEGDANNSVIIYSYLFEVKEDGTLVQLGATTGTIANMAHVLTGDTAVIYGNIQDKRDTATDALNPSSVTFRYGTPAESLNKLLWNLSEGYKYRAGLITALNVAKPEPEAPVEPEVPDTPVEATEELSEEKTLNKINSASGVAENVEFVKFEGFSGNTWFITEFTGKNAPNYAVRAVDGYTAWDADAAANTVKIDDVTTTKAGILLTNSSEYELYNVSVYRGTNTGKSRGGHAGATAYSCMARLVDGKHYIQIVGYEIIEGDASNSVTIYSYLFEVKEDGTLVQLGATSNKVANMAHVLTGNTAVIYGNIQYTKDDANKTDANNPESVTFRYGTPAESLEELINNLNDTYKYKAELKEALEIA